MSQKNIRRTYLLIHKWGKQEWLHFIYRAFTNGLDRIIMSEQNIALLKCFEV